MGEVVKKLLKKNLFDKNYSFSIELNKGVSKNDLIIHLEYNKLRLEMSESEFFIFSDLIIKAQKKLNEYK